MITISGIEMDMNTFIKILKAIKKEAPDVYDKIREQFIPLLENQLEQTK